ncbi:MmgE/PrpD family protein [Methanobacterium oryzae]|uniref:MmgE/PrpD family protein n=1 Tax=Methanobacterium oryzae TaxID=69540 RepID=UPI003D263854
MKFADFIESTEYEKLPPKVIDQAKLCFLDFLGVTLRGSKTKSAYAVNKIIKENNESTIIGHKKATALDASLANGIASHSLDLDDGHRIAQLHPGTCVIPAALALCESENKSGKELISSIVVGYEIMISMGILVNPEHRNRGFHSTGTCGAFGAAAAACKALNLDKEEIINAIGLAGTQASGLLESDHAGSMGKHLHAGKAAQSGILSALLAKEGFSGASTIIDGNEGFLSAMTDSNKDKKIDIGKFHILNVYFKKYPVCRHLHSAIDATLEILNKNDLKYEDIQKILVKSYKIAARHNDYNPETVEAIRQSLPVSLAIASKDKNLSLNNLENNEEIAKISSKIVIECDENLDDLYPNKRSSEVIIQTNSHSYINRVDLPKGEPENQFTKYELINKFNDLNKDINIDILSIIDNLEDYNVKELMIIINNEFKGHGD